MNTFFYWFHISATMWITQWLRQNLQNISQTGPLHATGMLRYCSESLKKRVQLRMCHNLGGLVWRQCGKIWKMEPPLWWMKGTPPHIILTVFRSLCQMLKRMKYHIYQSRLVPNYTILLSIHPIFFSSFFAHTNRGTDFCHILCLKKVLYVTQPNEHNLNKMGCAILIYLIKIFGIL